MACCGQYKEIKELGPEDYIECDYDKNVTPVYQAIEDKAWIPLNQFLHTSYWPGSFFQDPVPSNEQAATWVTRYDTVNGEKIIRWSQLPLHAAIVFGAPSIIIQQLIECFPYAAQLADDNKMLPLHLAFRFGAPDTVIALLLQRYPSALNVLGKNNRTPIEFAKKGPNPDRAFIIESILKKYQRKWEKKEAAEHMKEVYRVKEELTIKTQRVKNLEIAMNEIEQREEATKEELAKVMASIQGVQLKKFAKTTDKKDAVTLLVGKLEELEVATKDLVAKEKKTKKELRKSLGALKDVKDITLSPSAGIAADVKGVKNVELKESNNAGLSFEERSVGGISSVDGELELSDGLKAAIQNSCSFKSVSFLN